MFESRNLSRDKLSREIGRTQYPGCATRIYQSIYVLYIQHEHHDSVYIIYHYNKCKCNNNNNHSNDKQARKESHISAIQGAEPTVEEVLDFPKRCIARRTSAELAVDLTLAKCPLVSARTSSVGELLMVPPLGTLYV